MHSFHYTLDRSATDAPNQQNLMAKTAETQAHEGNIPVFTSFHTCGSTLFKKTAKQRTDPVLKGSADKTTSAGQARNNQQAKSCEVKRHWNFAEQKQAKRSDEEGAHRVACHLLTAKLSRWNTRDVKNKNKSKRPRQDRTRQDRTVGDFDGKRGAPLNRLRTCTTRRPTEPENTVAAIFIDIQKASIVSVNGDVVYVIPHK